MMPGSRPATSPLPIDTSSPVPRRESAQQEPRSTHQVPRRTPRNEAIPAPEPRAVKGSLPACVAPIQAWQILGPMPGQMTHNDGRFVDDSHAGAQRAMCPLVVLARRRQRRVLVKPARRGPASGPQIPCWAEKHVTVEQRGRVVRGWSEVFTVSTMPSPSGSTRPVTIASPELVEAGRQPLQPVRSDAAIVVRDGRIRRADLAPTRGSSPRRCRPASPHVNDRPCRGPVAPQSSRRLWSSPL